MRTPHDRDAASSRGPGGSPRPRTFGAPLWPLLGLLATAAIAAVDIGAGLLHAGRPSPVANVSGTLAIAPVLTSAGGTRRQTLAVGLVAALTAAALVLVDGVHGVPAVARPAVVLATALLGTWLAGARDRQLAQLQDRREAARTLQEAMLTDPPEPADLELAIRYLPASSGDRVGGDWYDAVPGPGGGTVLVIGDVTGHDVRAAAAMGQLRAVLRAYAVDRAESPARLLTRVEGAAPLLGLDVLATAVVVRLAPAAADGSHALTWSTAGHPPPVLVHPGGRVEVLADGAPDLLLGLEPASRHDATGVLPRGATLLLHTDGLVERREADLDDGFRRLHEALAAHAALPPGELVDAVLAQLLPGEPDDDVALLAVRARCPGAGLVTRGSRAAPAPPG
ncbi:PP2C family protein-serine/threonine phosphatase [Kineococcus glutinatus]|uniref:PPM-type phosphatase domain-containing protein n=1 Tax=Kineococcus glutinatus TaxID=1070872 RepID=A0ABP9H6Q4_9ACTN